MKFKLKDKIQELIEQGYEVNIEHFRVAEKEVEDKISPRGGITFATIFMGEELCAHGEARCSAEDNFNKKLGAQIALGRALHNWTGIV